MDSPDPPPSLADRNGSAPPIALIAGGSRGLGLEIAERLGERGHRLVLCARDAVELAEAQSALAASGYDVTTEVCDVSDADAVERLVADTELTRGPIAVLVAVAGVIQVGPLAALDRTHFREAIDVMLWGPINTALAVVPRMRRRGAGRIGIITSLGGLVSVPHLLPYSTAKFGAVGFSSGLRAELAGTGVTVTTVAPGLLRTGGHLQAKFVGDHGREYAWFATLGSSPLVAMDAARAADKIVDAVLAGRSWLVLTWAAKLAVRANVLLPRVTAAALDATSRLLPNAPEGRRKTSTVRGWTAKERLSDPAAAVVRGLTTLGSRAARRYRQRP